MTTYIDYYGVIFMIKVIYYSIIHELMVHTLQCITYIDLYT